MRIPSLCLTCAALLAPAGLNALSVSSTRMMQGWFAAPVVQAPEEPLFGGAIADSRLDGMRGGFEAGSGLRVAFGIERVVLINGQMTATTSLNLMSGEQGLRADALPRELVLGNGALRISTGGQGAGGAGAINLGLIQVGPNNLTTISPGLVAGTIIQNSLDGQTIQNVTTINASVNSMAMLKSGRFQEHLQAAMIASFRR